MRISDWSSDVCSSDLPREKGPLLRRWTAECADLAASRPGEARPIGARGQLVGALSAGTFADAAGRNREGRTRRGQQRSAPRTRAAGSRRHRQGNQRAKAAGGVRDHRSEEQTSELQSLMRISYSVFFLKK